MRLVAVVNDALGIYPLVDGRGTAVARERAAGQEAEAREGCHDRTD
jgi:hypothetical protein